jgi:hypothetical protein
MSLGLIEIGIPSPSVKPSTIKKDYQRENTRWTCKINGVTVDDSERYTYDAHMSLPHVLAFVTVTPYFY